MKGKSRLPYERADICTGSQGGIQRGCHPTQSGGRDPFTLAYGKIVSNPSLWRSFDPFDHKSWSINKILKG